MHTICRYQIMHVCMNVCMHVYIVSMYVCMCVYAKFRYRFQVEFLDGCVVKSSRYNANHVIWESQALVELLRSANHFLLSIMNAYIYIYMYVYMYVYVCMYIRMQLWLTCMSCETAKSPSTIANCSTFSN
jgi:hypothetical protein